VKRRERATAAAVSLLAAGYNVAVNRVLSPRTHVPANLAFAAAICGIGRVAARMSWSDLGLGRTEAGRGFRVGTKSSLMSAALVAAAAAAPWTRRFFADERILRSSRGAAVYEMCVRIPLATALPEEVVFRGVLLSVLSRSHTTATAIAWTSTLFGLWHVLPTLDTMRTNPIKDVLPEGWLGYAAAAGAALPATAATGALFALLRNRSGSVVAPVLTHTAINATAYLGGRLSHRHRPGQPIRGE
jgi:membrane protease YdiL (CAAX protease family)